MTIKNIFHHNFDESPMEVKTDMASIDDLIVLMNNIINKSSCNKSKEPMFKVLAYDIINSKRNMMISTTSYYNNNEHKLINSC